MFIDQFFVWLLIKALTAMSGLFVFTTRTPVNY